MLLLAPAVLIAALVWSVRTVRRARRVQLASRDARRPAPPEAVAPAPPLGRPSRLAGWLLLGSGGLVASGGGLLTLAVVVGMAVFGYEPEELASLVAGTATLGLLPLVLGLFLFLWGVRKLNRSTTAASS